MNDGLRSCRCVYRRLSLHAGFARCPRVHHCSRGAKRSKGLPHSRPCHQQSLSGVSRAHITLPPPPLLVRHLAMYLLWLQHQNGVLKLEQQNAVLRHRVELLEQSARAASVPPPPCPPCRGRAAGRAGKAPATNTVRERSKNAPKYWSELTSRAFSCRTPTPYRLACLARSQSATHGQLWSRVVVQASVIFHAFVQLVTCVNPFPLHLHSSAPFGTQYQATAFKALRLKTDVKATGDRPRTGRGPSVGT